MSREFLILTKIYKKWLIFEFLIKAKISEKWLIFAMWQKIIFTEN